MTGMTISQAVLGRRSIRAFEDRPVALETLRRVLDAARWSPSGCNFQPWEATILTGAPLKALQEKMLATPPQAPEEYAITPAALTAPYAQRLQTVDAAMYGAENIAQDDKGARGLRSAQFRVLRGGRAAALLFSALHGAAAMAGRRHVTADGDAAAARGGAGKLPAGIYGAARTADKGTYRRQLCRAGSAGE